MINYYQTAEAEYIAYFYLIELYCRRIAHYIMQRNRNKKVIITGENRIIDGIS